MTTLSLEQQAFLLSLAEHPLTSFDQLSNADWLIIDYLRRLDFLDIQYADYVNDFPTLLSIGASEHGKAFLRSLDDSDKLYEEIHRIADAANKKSIFAAVTSIIALIISLGSFLVQFFEYIN